MREQCSPPTGWFQSKRTNLVLLGLIVITGFFLITGHTAHFIGILPFAFILFCPLMHIFMMRGMHGSHGGHGGNNDQQRETTI